MHEKAHKEQVKNYKTPSMSTLACTFFQK